MQLKTNFTSFVINIKKKKQPDNINKLLQVFAQIIVYNYQKIRGGKCNGNRWKIIVNFFFCLLKFDGFVFGVSSLQEQWNIVMAKNIESQKRIFNQ